MLAFVMLRVHAKRVKEDAAGFVADERVVVPAIP